jgi:HEPN domain-containing protein
MTKDEHIKYWLKGAEDDLSAAESLFNAQKYNWCLFIAHLVLEKMLKAIFVLRNDNKIPPKTHNLVKLTELSSLDLTEEQLIFLDEVNSFNLESRYPDYKNEFYKKCDKEFTEEYLIKIKEFYKCLKSLSEQEK